MGRDAQRHRAWMLRLFSCVKGDLVPPFLAVMVSTWHFWSKLPKPVGLGMLTLLGQGSRLDFCGFFGNP